MSDDWLHIIPVDPNFIPPDAGVNTAVEILASGWTGPRPRVIKVSDEDWSPMSGKIVIQVITRESAEYVGMTVERIACPLCKEEIDVDWWAKTVGDACEAGFPESSIMNPCCGRDVQVNDLEYDGDAGFARFSISVKNPHIDDESSRVHVTGDIYRVRFTTLRPDDETLARVSQALGCPIRCLLVHV